MQNDNRLAVQTPFPWAFPTYEGETVADAKYWINEKCSSSDTIKNKPFTSQSMTLEVIQNSNEESSTHMLALKIGNRVV